MFAYCNNNPVVYIDSAGTSSAICFSEATNPFTPPTAEAGGAGGLSSVVGTLCILALTAAIADRPPALPQTKNKEEEVVSAKDPSPEDQYTVYFLYAANGSKSVIVYVGRVKTSGYLSRMAYHASKGRLPAGAIHELSYGACRAIEQAGMIMLHTLNPGNTIYNQIRGISPANKNRYNYLAEAFDLVNSNLYPEFSILPASYWFNFAENEYLNMGL